MDISTIGVHGSGPRTRQQGKGASFQEMRALITSTLSDMLAL